jgi:hypothetical protein
MVIALHYLWHELQGISCRGQPRALLISLGCPLLLCRESAGAGRQRRRSSLMMDVDQPLQPLDLEQEFDQQFDQPFPGDSYGQRPSSRLQARCWGCSAAHQPCANTQKTDLQCAAPHANKQCHTLPDACV